MSARSRSRTCWRTALRCAEIATLAVAACLAAGTTAGAQSLEPRAYVATPIDMNIVGVTYARSSGSVLFDPSLPVEDVSATTNATTLMLSRSFALFGRTASATAMLPYAWGDVSGKVEGVEGAVSRSGLADPAFRFVLHLAGGPALTPQQFVKAEKSTIVGVSLTVAPPLGQYTPAKVVNIGSNRWAFKPELAISKPARRWLFDAYAGVWLYTSNDAFYPGTQIRGQNPIATLQGHVSYNLTLRAWAAFDATWYIGGHTWMNGTPRGDEQNNSRLGATLSFPLGQRYSVKASYSWDLSTRTAASFDTLSVGWNVAWFAPKVWR